MKSPLPRLALTLGEPAGIGPDIVLASARHEAGAQIIVIGDPAFLEQRASRIGASVGLVEFDPDAPVTAAHTRTTVFPAPFALPAG